MTAETGKRLSVPRIQKFGKSRLKTAFWTHWKTGLHDYRIARPQRVRQGASRGKSGTNRRTAESRRGKAAADAKAKAEAEAKAKAEEKAALKAEILAELKAAGVIPAEPAKETKADAKAKAEAEDKPDEKVTEY